AGDLFGFYPRADLQPGDAPLAAVSLGYRGVHHAHAGAPDVRTRAVTLDERNDRVVRDDQLAAADRDLRALGGGRDSWAGGGGHAGFSWRSPAARAAGREMLAQAVRRKPAAYRRGCADERLGPRPAPRGAGRT